MQLRMSIMLKTAHAMRPKTYTRDTNIQPGFDQRRENTAIHRASHPNSSSMIAFAGTLLLRVMNSLDVLSPISYTSASVPKARNK